MDLDAVKSAYAQYVMATYRRADVAFVRGRGCLLYDTEGNEWLDCLAGIAVCGLGHAHPRIAQAIAEQAAELLHTSNLYYIPRQAELAARLVPLTGLDRAFFCNSGAEAIEACLKIARKWGKTERGGAWKVIAAEGSFHGRTLGALSCTGQAKYQEPFLPLVPGVVHVPYGNVEALSEAADAETAAVLLEPIQGESGVRIPCEGYLTAVWKLCDERGIMLILDEIQTGLGRTGRWFGFEHEGVVPDAIALAKSLAAGFPMGACVAREPFASVLQPGDHASTFGGNPLACAAACAFLEVMEEERVLDNVVRMGDHARHLLESVAATSGGRVGEVRGRGLMLAIELVDGSAQAVNTALFRRRVLANAIGDSVLRILPPLTIGEAELDRFAAELGGALADTA